MMGVVCGEGGGLRAIKGKGEGMVGSWWRMERYPAQLWLLWRSLLEVHITIWISQSNRYFCIGWTHARCF